MGHCLLGNVMGLQTRTGWYHGRLRARARVGTFDPCLTRTHDAGLMGVTGFTGRCD